MDVRGLLCTGFEKFSTWKWAGRQFICSGSGKSINSRFTDHLEQCIALTRFRPEVSTFPGKTTPILANQNRTQPSAATDHAVTPTVVVQFSTSPLLIALIALTRSRPPQSRLASPTFWHLLQMGENHRQIVNALLNAP